MDALGLSKDEMGISHYEWFVLVFEKQDPLQNMAPLKSKDNTYLCVYTKRKWNDRLDCDDKSLKVETENTDGVGAPASRSFNGIELLAAS